MTTKHLALALAHIEKTIRIGTLECVWLAAIVDSPGMTYNELAEGGQPGFGAGAGRTLRHQSPRQAERAGIAVALQGSHHVTL